MLPHASMAERRDLVVRDHDWVRRALMFEPRGHDVIFVDDREPLAHGCQLG